MADGGEGTCVTGVGYNTPGTVISFCNHCYSKLGFFSLNKHDAKMKNE